MLYQYHIDESKYISKSFYRAHSNFTSNSIPYRPGIFYFLFEKYRTHLKKITNTSYTLLITISFAYIWISNFFFTLQHKQCTKRRHTKSVRQNGKSLTMLNRTEGIKVSAPKIRFFSRLIHKLILEIAQGIEQMIISIQIYWPYVVKV